MPTNVIHPDGELPAGAPTRNAAVLLNSYFLDRFVVALASVFAAIGISFGAFHAIGLRTEAIQRGAISRKFLPSLQGAIDYGQLSVEIARARALDAAYAFDHSAPIYEQFAQFTVNVLTWPPITVALLACGVLAVTGQRYAY